MSVYTFLDEKQIAELLALYGINYLQSHREVTDGIENSNYFVHANNKNYVLTIFEKKSVDALNIFFEFMMTASNAGFPLPTPIKNLQGQRLSYFYQNVQGNKIKRHFILCNQLDGKHPKNISIELCKNVGQEFAKLHQLSHKERIKGGFKETDIAFIIPQNNQNPSGTFDLSFLSEEKQQVYYEELAFIKKLNNEFTKLPKGICHCDFFPDNALITNNDNKPVLSAFLDWYDAQYTAFIYDLAVLAISWCNYDSERHKIPINQDKVNALLKAYEGIRPLSDNEKEQWLNYMRAAAFKFWIHREIYHNTMQSSGMEDNINPKKSPEEFWHLLCYLKA